MSATSLGRYLEEILADNTHTNGFIIDVYGVAAALGFIIRKVDMFGTDAGVLIPNPPQPKRQDPNRPELYLSRLELNQKLPESTLRPVAAWLLAGYLMSGNMMTSRHFKCEIFYTRSWRTYKMCAQMFLATRLLMPIKVIDAYCRNVEPGAKIFDSATYAKVAGIDHIFVQCCYANSDVQGLLGLVSDLELSLSSKMKDMVESNVAANRTAKASQS